MAGFLKKLLKIILIGGGTILSALCPPVGGAVVTAGMAIGAGAVSVGSLIPGQTTTDKVISSVNAGLQNAGLLNPAPAVTTSTGQATAFVMTPVLWIILALGIILLFFKRK